MKKWKYSTLNKLHENIDSLVKYYNLSNEVKEAITSISKNSYTLGSNDCYLSFKLK